MYRLFYQDSIHDINISYSDLFFQISQETRFYTYCKTDSYYETFKQIVFSLIIGERIILLDSDFSDDEIKNLIGDMSLINSVYKDVSKSAITIDTVRQKIIDNSKSWEITLFTSGTTGLPKMISHSFESISRFVRESEKHSENVWGFAYNPTHMAGIQVFLQAFLNFNPIVRLFGIGREGVLDQINKYQITNISATPTFYRLLLPVTAVYESVNRLTSGGENFDSNTLTKIQKMFPNAKITNVYASTEAGTLFASVGNNFIVKEQLRNLVRIINNELFLHKSLIGYSDILKLDGDWYATNDMVEVVEENPLTFKFLYRKSEMINVGGYKVNPEEVESVIRQCEYVRDVVVYAKNNRILGNIVCCEVVSKSLDLSELTIRDFLRNKLQEFKIPRLIKFVDKLQTTRTGKLLRK